MHNMANSVAVLNQENTLRHLALVVARNQVGLKEPIADVLARESVAPAELDALLNDGIFKRYVREYTDDLTENGFGFKAKSRLLAEAGLHHMHYIVEDMEQPAVARIKAQECLVKWAGLEPQPNLQQQGQGTGFKIVFNMPSLPSGQPSGSVTIEQQPQVPTITLPSTPTSSIITEAELAGEDECDDADAYIEPSNPDPWGGRVAA